jgi:hypothetical protein
METAKGSRFADHKRAESSNEALASTIFSGKNVPLRCLRQCGCPSNLAGQGDRRHGMFDSLLRPIAAFGLGVLHVATAGAAEIRVDPSHGSLAGAVLEERIERGDFDKFKKYVLNGDNAGLPRPLLN